MTAERPKKIFSKRKETAMLNLIARIFGLKVVYGETEAEPLVKHGDISIIA